MSSHKKKQKPVEHDGDLFFDLETGSSDLEKAGKQLKRIAGSFEKDCKKTRILVEVVSALYVPSMDKFSDADPFVCVSMGARQIHQTKVIYNNPNPIWTLETGSLFLIECNEQEVNPKKDKVTFTLKDYDMVQKATVFGSVEILLKDMINGKGRRKVYSIDVPEEVLDFNEKKNRAVMKKTKLVLRFKPPSMEELHFVKTIQEGQSGVFANETFLPPEMSRFQIIENNKNKEHSSTKIQGWGAELLETATREPDDDGNEQLDTPMITAMEPSENWVEVGSGNEGKLYVEILGCNGLPNMDSPTLTNLNNMTDAYCCLVMEDSIVNTSIIEDTLSPRWMPKDQRAFVFHVQHPSSQLFVSVFDHDTVNRFRTRMKASVHDPIGRVLINLTQFNPGTLYTLQYHIYHLGVDEQKNRNDETPNGTLILRLRVEWGSASRKNSEAKNMLIAGGGLPPASFVALSKRHDFQVAHYTTVGKHDQTFSMTTLTNYVEELKDYADEEVIATVVDGAMTVLLWRGHWKVSLGCCSCKLPLHSMVAFAWGIAVTRDYNRLLSFLLFSVAWFFLATNERRRTHPSPWHQCKSYHSLLRDLTGCCINASGTTIGANQNLHAIHQYHATECERKEALAEQKEQAALQQAEMEKEELKYAADIKSAENDTVVMATSKSGGVLQKMNPLKPILFPVQKMLHQLCVVFRIATSIVTWEENFYPFWIVTLCLVGSLLVFFIPWGFIFRWTISITAWLVLGPWMKIVDWVYFGKRAYITDEARRDSLRNELRAEYKKRLQYRLLTQQMQEKAIKFRSMMKYMFGEFVIEVPRFRYAQFYDYPLPASTAKPYQKSDEDIFIAGQICGQRLVGDMIPKRMHQEHSFSIPEPERRSSLFGSWGSASISQSPSKKEQNENQPLLLSKQGGKKKTSIFSLFNLRGEGKSHDA